MARTKSFDPEAAVDAAMRVFWSQGYAGTTPRQLAEAMGIGAGSLYHAFGSKAALYERALRRYYEVEATRIIAVLDAAGSPRQRIRAALELVVTATLGDSQGHGCLAANAAVEFADRDPTVNQLVRRICDRQEAAFRSTIEEGQRAGEIAAEAAPDQLAALLLTTINGIRVLGKADPDPQRLRGSAEAALRAL